MQLITYEYHNKVHQHLTTHRREFRAFKKYISLVGGRVLERKVDNTIRDCLEKSRIAYNICPQNYNKT